MAKYIIELEDKADENGKVFAKDFKALCFDDYGLSKLTPYEEPKPEKEVEEWPKKGDLYWTLDGIGDVLCGYWALQDCISETECDRLAIGNVFRTKEEAEFAVERLKVIAELKKYAEPDDTPWITGRISHWYIFYNSNIDTIRYGLNDAFKSARIYFPSEDVAKKAVAAVGEEHIKKYYLGVKE